MMVSYRVEGSTGCASKAPRRQPSEAARMSGYDDEGQLPDTQPVSRSRPEADYRERLLSGREFADGASNGHGNLPEGHRSSN